MAVKPGPVKRENLTDEQWDRVSRLFTVIARAKKRLRERSEA